MKKRPKPRSEPDYPSLEEHLLTRRDLLTFVGASLVTGSLWVSCVAGDDDSGPGYYTVRLPSQGDDLAIQSGGGAIRYYLSISVYSDYGYYGLIDAEAEALQACREVLAQQDFALLAAATQGGDGEPYHQAEQALATALLPYLCDTECWDVYVALTIREFLP